MESIRRLTMALVLSTVAAGCSCATTPVFGTRDGGWSDADRGRPDRGPLLAGDGQVGVLTAHVENLDGLRIEIVIIACAGACADVIAVASGGNPGYSFEWSDGVDTAARRVCPTATQTLTVTVTDTPIADSEFPTTPMTAIAELTAEVLICPYPPDGGVSSCGPDAVSVTQLVTAHESAPTGAYAQANGYLDGYVATTFGGLPAAIVASSTQTIRMGSCAHLYLAGDAAGTEPAGWDDSLVVELRTPGNAVVRRWYYGSGGTLTYQPTGDALTSALAPTVPGTSIDPPILNPLPYGYAPRAIDLMEQIPADVGELEFELAMYVLDVSNVGSTSEIWLLPTP